MCKDCHDTIHYLFSNKELYHQYNELEILKEELKNRLIHETLGSFMFLIEENGAVAPNGLEHLPCKRTVEGSSPFSALGMWYNGNMSPCHGDVPGSSPGVPAMRA